MLTFEDVHRIRTEKQSDAHWEQTLGVSRTAAQKARTGVTWGKHPTPPDTEPRVESNNPIGRPETHNLPGMSGVDRMLNQALLKWPRVPIHVEQSGRVE